MTNTVYVRIWDTAWLWDRRSTNMPTPLAPEHALCDGPQSLRPEKFADMMAKIAAIRPYADRSFTTGGLVLE